MDFVLLVPLCGIAFAISTLLWHLLVQPHVVISLFNRGEVTEGDWADRELEAALRGLRWSLGSAVFAVGLITGATLSFLAATSA